MPSKETNITAKKEEGITTAKAREQLRRHDDYEALTDAAPKCHAPMPRLKTKDPTIPRWNAYTPPNIRADAERRPVRREQRALSARGATWGVCGRPWIDRAAPEGVGALEGEKRLGDVCLGEDYGTCCAKRRDDLYGQVGKKCVWQGKVG